jgi:hypothetical protein
MSSPNSSSSPSRHLVPWAVPLIWVSLGLLPLLSRTSLWKTPLGDLIGLLLVVSASYAAYLVGSKQESSVAISMHLKRWLRIRGLSLAAAFIILAIYWRFLITELSWNTRPIFGGAILLLFVTGYASEIIRANGDAHTISARRRWLLVVVTGLAMLLWLFLVFA